MSYSLGIDVGVASIGTAEIRENEPPKLYVRIFPSVTGSTIKTLAAGKDKAEDANNAQRRQKRLQRRQTARRRRRMAKLFHQLQRAKLLPAGESKTPLERDKIIKDLDKTLLAQLLPEIADHTSIKNRNVPYILRALALERELQPFELGRALYHLAQRRGFKSNRKVKENVSSDEEKETGKVKSSIEKLRQELGEVTLGQFFASINSDKSGQLVRNRNIGKKPKREELAKKFPPHYTARDLYEEEFNRIWAAQVKFWRAGNGVADSGLHHPILNLPFRREVHNTIFYQRPLKSQAGRIGYCELEPNRRRAPIACLEFQRYRYWQVLHNIIVYLPNRDWNNPNLTLDEKQNIAELCEKGDCSWKSIADFFGWKKQKGQKQLFNYEETKEEELHSNKTAKSIRKVFPDWDNLTDEKKNELVDILLADSPEKRIAKRICDKFGLDNVTAARLSNVSLSPDYASYSLAALRKLLNSMQNGKSLYEALEECYPDRNNPKQILPYLPPVKDILPYIANPSVLRSLTELRKVVNALIRQNNGEKPEVIRVELVRILKAGRKKREAAHDRMLENREKRKKAKEKLQKQDFWLYGEPTRMDVTKWMLWEECKGQDPYSGDTISLSNLFGSNPTYDVEHIYPKSLTGDSSFANLTLCSKDYNLRKSNRTPKAAFGNTPEYEAMLQRAKLFNKDKAARFEEENVPAGFRNRMLNDTSYIATAAVQYLATLYGGTVEKGFNADRTGTRRIEIVPGQATARLRRLWGLNGILGPNALKDPDILADEPPEKYRADHRHHAIDAFVIANCSPEVIKQWAAEEEKREYQRRQNEEKYRMNLLPPYGEDKTFDTVRQAVNAITVSHRPDHRVSGALHNENSEKKEAKYTVKIPIPANDRSAIARYFKQGENHHVEVFEIVGKKGETKWEVKPVTLFTAYQRTKYGKPVINPDARPKFLFALHKGDCVKIYRNALDKQNDRNGEVFRIAGVDTGGSVKIWHHTDARPWDMKFTKEYQEKYDVPVRPSLSSLKSRLVKVNIDVLGTFVSDGEEIKKP